MREQQKANIIRACIAIYGFPEEGNDFVQLQDMFVFLGCPCDIMRSSRIGRPPQRDGDKARPIKVELRSASDATAIISRAKYLWRDNYYGGVQLCKWRSDEEMKEIKSLRQQCDSLNKNNHSGPNQYFVISGKIMQRDAKGRLQAYHYPLGVKSGGSTVSASAPSGGQHLISSLPLSQSKNGN
mgnify:CR=1 FL=1